jgi:hypothetical protein
MGLQTQQQDRELEPVKLRINAISDRFARELTGFSADRELGLTTLMDKLKRERELSDQEWTRAQQLADEERAYQRQKAAAAASLANYTTASRPTATDTPTPAKPTVDIGSYLNYTAPSNANNALILGNNSGLSRDILSGLSF